ncbi:MAG: methyltransferase domain-containing protein [Sedimentisphaerales bacterium]|nr:methyltransferase domain-containing protein [Sedimentisphaerales bacterium]
MGIFDRFSAISRKRKYDLFCRLMNPSEHDKILDIGGETESSLCKTLQFIDLFPNQRQLSAINISESQIKTIVEKYPEIDARVGDACELPWPDDFFDIVYSNAVIEHVGNYDRQKKMASEIMRVSRTWFVTTPNRWYPFEFHMRLPFVTWLPFHGYLYFARILCYNHARGKYVCGMKLKQLRLLTENDLKEYFPNSRIIKQRVTFLPETLIVVGSKGISN